MNESTESFEMENEGMETQVNEAPSQPEQPANEQPPEASQPAASNSDLEAEFKRLMAEGKELEDELKEKSGGVVTVDDTMDRVRRQDDIATSGRRRGRKFEPTKGVAAFMVKQNAHYVAQGKIEPYSKECIKNTLKREMGVLKGKAE